MRLLRFVRNDKENSDIVAVGPVIEKEVFHSSFKTWLRVVAFIVVAVFLPEQVAQAVEYDARVLWHRPITNTAFTPAALKNPNLQDIPLAIKNLLKEVSNKPVTSIKISPTVSIELDKPASFSSQRIDEIYNWLIGKPCGAKALYDYLSYAGSQAQEQDIAVVVLTADIVNDVVKPEGNPEVIKNSLFALSKASEFFGQKLFPIQLTTNDQPRLPSDTRGGQGPTTNDQRLTTNLTPFIAHLKGDHYILITKITEDKVYFSDNHKEDFLPKEKFLEQFSGYALVAADKLPATGYVLLTDKEAKAILGAKSRRDKGLDYFGMAAGGLLMAGGPISGRSLLTMATNYGISYAAPKLLNVAGLDKTTSNIGGAFLAGGLTSGINYGWNYKPMISQALTRTVVAGVQEIGYNNKWDTKSFVGATFLASTIAGDFAQVSFNKALNIQFGVAKNNLKLNESKLAYSSGGKAPYTYVQGVGRVNSNSLISGYNFQSSDLFSTKEVTAKKLIGYGSEGLRYFSEDKFSKMNSENFGFARAMGGLTSGAFERFSGLIINNGSSAGDVAKGIFGIAGSSVLNGFLSQGLQYMSGEAFGLGKYTGTVLNMALTSGLYGAFSKVEGGGTHGDLMVQTFLANRRMALGGFFSANLGTLNNKGDIYYYKGQDASYAATLLDFNRVAEGLPNTGWTKGTTPSIGYDSTGKIVTNPPVDYWGKYIASGGNWKPPDSDFRHALINQYFSALNSQATNNLTRLVMNRLTGVYNQKIGGEWGEAAWSHIKKSNSSLLDNIAQNVSLNGAILQWNSLDNIYKATLDFKPDPKKPNTFTTVPLNALPGKELAAKEIKKYIDTAPEDKVARAIVTGFESPETIGSQGKLKIDGLYWETTGQLKDAGKADTAVKTSGAIDTAVRAIGRGGVNSTATLFTTSGGPIPYLDPLNNNEMTSIRPTLTIPFDFDSMTAQKVDWTNALIKLEIPRIAWQKGELVSLNGGGVIFNPKAPMGMLPLYTALEGKDKQIVTYNSDTITVNGGALARGASFETKAGKITFSDVIVSQVTGDILIDYNITKPGSSIPESIKAANLDSLKSLGLEVKQTGTEPTTIWYKQPIPVQKTSLVYPDGGSAMLLPPGQLLRDIQTNPQVKSDIYKIEDAKSVGKGTYFALGNLASGKNPVDVESISSLSLYSMSNPSQKPLANLGFDGSATIFGNGVRFLKNIASEQIKVGELVAKLENRLNQTKEESIKNEIKNDLNILRQLPQNITLPGRQDLQGKIFNDVALSFNLGENNGLDYVLRRDQEGKEGKGGYTDWVIQHNTHGIGRMGYYVANLDRPEMKIKLPAVNVVMDNGNGSGSLERSEISAGKGPAFIWTTQGQTVDSLYRSHSVEWFHNDFIKAEKFLSPNDNMHILKIGAGYIPNQMGAYKDYVELSARADVIVKYSYAGGVNVGKIWTPESPQIDQGFSSGSLERNRGFVDLEIGLTEGAKYKVKTGDNFTERGKADLLDFSRRLSVFSPKNEFLTSVSEMRSNTDFSFLAPPEIKESEVLIKNTVSQSLVFRAEGKINIKTDKDPARGINAPLDRGEQGIGTMSLSKSTIQGLSSLKESKNTDYVPVTLKETENRFTILDNYNQLLASQGESTSTLLGLERPIAKRSEFLRFSVLGKNIILAEKDAIRGIDAISRIDTGPGIYSIEKMGENGALIGLNGAPGSPLTYAKTIRDFTLTAPSGKLISSTGDIRPITQIPGIKENKQEISSYTRFTTAGTNQIIDNDGEIIRLDTGEGVYSIERNLAYGAKLKDVSGIEKTADLVTDRREFTIRNPLGVFVSSTSDSVTRLMGWEDSKDINRTTSYASRFLTQGVVGTASEKWDGLGIQSYNYITRVGNVLLGGEWRDMDGKIHDFKSAVPTLNTNMSSFSISAPDGTLLASKEYYDTQLQAMEKGKEPIKLNSSIKDTVSMLGYGDVKGRELRAIKDASGNVIKTEIIETGRTVSGLGISTVGTHNQTGKVLLGGEWRDRDGKIHDFKSAVPTLNTNMSSFSISAPDGTLLASKEYYDTQLQ
ncbi:MAG: cysteine peptidase family C39 domain-containing protein, partial [Candidatus Omnitrophica bacterium]|nr:cysteine peptidase family C39 domain-containing protein [Candidatus Omnitrophota bacterium]